MKELEISPKFLQVNDDLFEHIDALQSGLKRPVAQHATVAPPTLRHLTCPFETSSFLALTWQAADGLAARPSGEFER